MAERRYRLEINARVPNEQYEAQRKAHAELQAEAWRRGCGVPDEPTPSVDEAVLLVELTEAQWNAVRRAVLEVF